jgi:hypothetical protein
MAETCSVFIDDIKKFIIFDCNICADTHVSQHKGMDYIQKL